jgi:tight adherence protein B
VTGLTWLLLGFGVLLLPGVDPAAMRARLLTARGRLAEVPARTVRAPLPRPELLASVGCIAATGAVFGLAGPVLAAATGIGAATLARLVLGALRGRAARRRDAELCTAVRLVAAELESGSGPSAALTAAADAAPTWRAEFSAGAEACHAGDDPRFEAAELRGLGDAWRVADRAGAPLAAVVRRVADDLAGRVAQRQAVTAAVAGARSSAALLAVLPVLGLLLGAAMQAHPLGVLLTTRAGQLICFFGVAFDAAGVLWTQRLAASAERT